MTEGKVIMIGHSREKISFSVMTGHNHYTILVFVRIDVQINVTWGFICQIIGAIVGRRPLIAISSTVVLTM